MNGNEPVENNVTAKEERNRPGDAKRPYLWMILSGVLLVVIVIVLIKPPYGNSDNETVATVNGTKINKAKLYDSLVSLYGPQELDNLITQELIIQEAKNQGIQITDADVDKEMDLIKGDYGSDEAFTMALQQYGMTMEDFREEMEVQVRLRKLLEPKVDVTEEEVKQFYDENVDRYAEPEQVRASHILVQTKEEAEAVLEQLKEGADFAELAKEKSIDPGSKGLGGDLDFFPRGMMHESFEDAAFALETGETSDIVETIDGFHIIKKTAHKPATTPAYEDKKEEIRAQLVDNEIYGLASSWIAEIKSTADIENFLLKD